MTPAGRCLCTRSMRLLSVGSPPTIDPHTVFSDLLLGRSFFIPFDAYEESVEDKALCY